MKDYIKTQIELHKRIAQNYDERYKYAYARLYQNYWNRSILSLVKNGYRREHRILELGCGTGTFLKELLGNYRSIYGIDISIDMLKQINLQKDTLKGVIVGDGMKTPFGNSVFDIIVCRGVLHHLPDISGAIIELHRLLKTGGSLIFSEPSNDSLIVKFARKIMYKKSDKFSEDDVAFHSRELKKILNKNGYQIYKLKRFGFFSYVFAGFPDHFALLSKIPGNVIIVKILILIDKILSILPILNHQSLHIIIYAKKNK